MKNYNKFLGIDIIRVVSMFCVILLHCASNRLRVGMDSAGWDIANVLTAAATCGVPMFFMISGALILSSKNTYSIKYTLKNRVLRLIVPMAVWSCIAVAVRLYTSEDTAVTLSNFYNEIIYFFNKPVAVHLWFMYYLIPMYLISPALKVFVDNAKEGTVKYILILWLIQLLSLTLGGILKEQNQLALANVNIINNIGFISGYLGYFLLGWYLFNNDVNISSRWLFVIAVGAVVFIAVGTVHITEYNGYYTETYKSYRSIFVAVLACAVFLILNRIKKVPDKLLPVISMLSSVSYGVYLSHNVIIDLLNKWGFKNHSIVVMTETFVIASVSSILLVWILGKIKYIGTILAGVKKS